MLSNMSEKTPTILTKGKALLYIQTIGYSHVQFAFTIGKWLVDDGYEVVSLNIILASF